MATRDAIREWVLVQGHSQRSAAQRFGVARKTVAAVLAEDPAPTERRYVRQQPAAAPVRDAALPHIDGWLAENERLARVAPKQRWTAHRMWLELQRLGVAIAEPTVRALVARQRPRRPQAFVPLTFRAGERMEVDFGHVVVVLAGVEQQVPLLVCRLRYSGAMYVECFPTERQECLLLGQQHAFEFWGGVPRTVVYDNLKPAVAKLLTGHRRVEQAAFQHFRSVYAYEAVFANPRAGWEKGSVENLVGYARRRYCVPLPEAATLPELNAQLRAACLADPQRVMADRSRPIAEDLAADRAALLPLPVHAPQTGVLREVLVRSTARIRFETNTYSVPVRYVGRRLALRADPWTVRLSAGEEVVAEHPRCYERLQAIEDFRHYVPLLLEKPFAIPAASPLQTLPPSWEAFRRELVARRPDGNREFARLLALCLHTPTTQVTAALAVAVERGAYSAEGVRQVLAWAEAPAAPTPPLDPVAYPQYQGEQPPPDLGAYNRLLGDRR